MGVAVVAASVLFVVLIGMRPSYDPYGWLVWGRQVLHWNLNTDGAPSWKPLTFLFTLPYALFGHTAVSLWMVTSVVGTLAGAVFAGRIAYRLCGPCPARPYAPYVAAAFAGVGLLGMNTYAHLILIANSDQLNVALCLAAIDAHLSRRPRLAFAMVLLAALGRPEVWPFAALYGAWLWWRLPSMRIVAVLGLALIPVFWFAIPALTSKSWLRAGDLALNQMTVIHGNKLVGVIRRWGSLYELPMQLAAGLGVLVAIIRRDLVTLGLAATAALWVAIEIAFAYHGWSAVSRYLIEPAAVMIVIAGGLVGRLIADTSAWGSLARWLGPVLVIALAVTLVPAGRRRARVWRDGIAEARLDAKAIDRLDDVIDRDGGGSKVRACGQPVSLIQYQSTLAWAVGLNVGNTGYNPGKSINRGKPIVLFKPYHHGWQVRPYNLAPATRSTCEQLRVDSDMN
ncbi:MAG: hypothetical protein ACR2NR_07035 [Solirubrobacteraceae bacterium]